MRGMTFPWARFSDEKLLDLRLRDLGVSIAATPLEDRVEELYQDLKKRGLKFRPHVWLSSDWFSPKGIPGVAIPFYLAHRRLMRLERAQMLECEGGTQRECQKILRHECGHAIQNAYRLNRRRSWQQTFGRSSQRYPRFYRPNPASRSHVQHLRLFYAQSHPEEDFAETFAVWMQPEAVWRRKYEGWPALKKIEFVGELMDELRGRAPLVRLRSKVEPLDSIDMTLREHYSQRMKHYQPQNPRSYDHQLRRMFSADPADRSGESASAFLRRNRAAIRKLVARWTGEYEYTLNQVLDDMIERCRVMRLRAVGEKPELRMDFAVLLTVETMHFHYNRRHWIAL